jgi:glycerophosphoryl diester phosphodiesterase family protein
MKEIKDGMKDGMKDIDDDLKHALQREEPPVGFADRVLLRVAEKPGKTLLWDPAKHRANAFPLPSVQTWGPPSGGPIRLSASARVARYGETSPKPGEGGKPDPTGSVEPAAEFPFRGCGINIPTLAAVLAKYRNVPIVVELKVNDPGLARAVVNDIRQADAIDRVCLGSFGLRVLREARRFEPGLATSAAREEVRWALYRSWCRWPVTRAGYGGYQVPEWSGRTRVVSRRFVEDAHAAGLGVQVWTVDAEPDAARLLAWGVDALITDRPDIIVPFVHGREAS